MYTQTKFAIAAIINYCIRTLCTYAEGKGDHQYCNCTWNIIWWYSICNEQENYVGSIIQCVCIMVLIRSVPVRKKYIEVW